MCVKIRCFPSKQGNDWLKQVYSKLEWLKSYLASIIVFALGVNSILIPVNDYAVRYYGATKSYENAAYELYLPACLILVALYFAGSIFIRWKLTQKPVGMTWDVILIALLALLLQFYFMQKMQVALNV